MLKACKLCLLFLLITPLIYAQSTADYKKKIFIHKCDSLPYRILYPVAYNEKKKYPVLVFLHGAGERGIDNEKQLVHGSKLFLRDSIRKKFPAIIIFPQCPENSYWSNMIIEKEERLFFIDRPPTKAMNLLMHFIKDFKTKGSIQKKQLYIGGLSMGGMGVLEIAARQPSWFNAAFAICGGGDTTAATKMIQTRWWLFHGEKDNVVLPEYSRQMAEALRDAGAAVRLSIYPDANHNSWDKAFAEKELLPWLFSHKL
ncbi:MAG: prolyl oligopeptidase family serine peptidase [Ferruginibacter sp.]